MNRILCTFVVAAAAVVGGCARIDYVKVPTPTQYSSWTDVDQKKVDKMKGVRYYMPRPFVHLKQSIPVAQRTAFVSFVKSADGGGYQVEFPTDTPTWVRRAVPARLSVTQALAAMLAPSSSSRSAEGSVQSDKGNEGPNTASPSTKPSEDRPPSELRARTGFINDEDPVTRLSDKMDVVYLPDFEEQYVIQVQDGLGVSNVETRLRNGWAAETFGYNVDNSNVIPYAIKQVENASKAAADIFTTWAPLAMGPGGAAAANALKAAGGLQADRGETDVLGDVLVFKVAEVKVAQPGLYPLLKPREIRQWLKSSAVVNGPDAEATFELFLEQANAPWIRPDLAFIPCPPFTMIGFNCTTDIFLSPATERIAQAAATSDGDSSAISWPTREQVAALAERLKADLEVGAERKHDTKVELSQDGSKVIVHVTVSGSAPVVPFGAAERTNLKLTIVGSAAAVKFNPAMLVIELPLSDDLLLGLKEEIKTALGDKWKVESVAGEDSNGYKVVLKKLAGASETNEEASASVDSALIKYATENGAGPRKATVEIK